jgi:transmembrane sensor
MQNFDENMPKAASDWIARLNSGSFSASDEVKLRIWLDESEENRREYHQQVMLWQELGSFENELFLESAKLALPEGVENPTRNIVDMPVRAVWRRLSIAATGLVAVSLFAGFLIFSNSDKPMLGTQHYVTNKGHQTEAQLVDNTRILMNTDSNLTVEYKKASRHVALEKGEVFFDVASDPERPFIVETEWGNVRVLGTKFNVFSSKDGLQVDVLEGLVEIIPRSDLAISEKEVFLTANQTMTVSSKPETVTAVHLAQPEQIAPWRGGVLSFSGQPLSEVIKEINRYSNREIRIASPSLVPVPVSGSFNIGDVTAFLDGLETLLPLKAKRRGGAIFLELQEAS